MKLFVKNLGSLIVSFFSIISRAKISQVMRFIPDPNSRKISAIGMGCDALKPSFVIRLSGPIHTVLAVGSLSQIAPAIIRPIHIDVVDLMVRPFAVHQGPRDAVGELRHTVDVYGDVAVRLCGTSNISSLGSNSPRSGTLSPSKNSTYGIIRQKSLKFFDGCSHWHDLKVIGFHQGVN